MSKIDVDRLAEELVRGAKALIMKEFFPMHARLVDAEKRIAGLEKSLADRGD